MAYVYRHSLVISDLTWTVFVFTILDSSCPTEPNELNEAAWVDYLG